MKYCKKCKKIFSDKYNFCENCGGKLSKMREEKEKKIKKRITSKRKGVAKEKEFFKDFRFILIIVILIALFLIYMVPPRSIISGDGEETGTACRDVQEPYDVPLSYSVIDSSLKESWNLQRGFYYTYKITVSNSDNTGGNFKVTFQLSTSKHGTLIGSQTQYISAHSSKTFESIFDTDMGEEVSGQHQVIPPTKTEYRTVRKCE